MASNVDLPIVVAEGAFLPAYATEGAAGMDLCSIIDISLGPMERKFVPTGIRIAVPEGYEAQIRARSGLALRHGLALVNSPGTIDSDYRGEIGVIMINLGTESVSLTRGERVAQLVLSPVSRANLSITLELEKTERGEGGFGSTGTRTHE